MISLPLDRLKKSSHKFLNGKQDLHICSQLHPTPEKYNKGPQNILLTTMLTKYGIIKVEQFKKITDT